MKDQTKQALIQTLAYVLVAALLVTAFFGYQKVAEQREEFEKISASVDSFTAQVEEKYPVLKDSRESAQKTVDEITAGA